MPDRLNALSRHGLVRSVLQVLEHGIRREGLPDAVEVSSVQGRNSAFRRPDVLLQDGLHPPCGYVCRLAALFDDPEVLVSLYDLFDARLKIDGCVPGRNSEALRSRSDLLPFSSGELYADRAIDPPALASKTCHLKATPKPVVLAPVEVPAKGLVFRDALCPRHRLLRQPGGLEGLPLVPKQLPADDLVAFESPKLCMSLQEIDLLAAVHPLFDQHDHMLACVAQLIVEV